MKIDKRDEYLTRENVLKLLSDEEIARVSSAETAARLADGEEYLDFHDLDRGVMRAAGELTPMNRVLPRKAVGEETWTKIVEQLASVATTHPGI